VTAHETTARKRRPYAARVPMAERREQLLDAALAVIDREGHDGVSIDAVAKEAGVTRPVVYGAFDGLGALLGALLDRQQQRAVAQLYAALPVDVLDGALDEPVRPVELVERAVPALHAMLLGDPVTWRVVLQSGAAFPDVVRERIDADRLRVLGTVELMVGAALPEGYDAEVLAHATIALLEHFGRLVLADPESFPAERLATAARAMIGAWLP
jgi:AcrR family transcriptional regulator